MQTLQQVNEFLGIELKPEAFEKIGLPKPDVNELTNEYFWDVENISLTALCLLHDYFGEKLDQHKGVKNSDC